MGREVRRVALGWQPPKMPCRYIHGRMSDPCPGWHWQPHFDETLERAQADWDARKARWESGEDKTALKYPDMSFEDWEGKRPDEPEWYRPEWPEGTPLGYCYYETVSEGTPVSPVFAAQDELSAWLVDNEGFSPEGARRFVEAGWAPSLVATPETGLIKGTEAVARGVL